MQIKTTLKFTFTAIRMAKIDLKKHNTPPQKKNLTVCAGEDPRRSLIIAEHKLVEPLWVSVWWQLRALVIYLNTHPYYRQMYSIAHILKDSTFHNRDICSTIFPDALYIHNCQKLETA